MKKFSDSDFLQKWDRNLYIDDEIDFDCFFPIIKRLFDDFRRLSPIYLGKNCNFETAQLRFRRILYFQYDTFLVLN